MKITQLLALACVCVACALPAKAATVTWDLAFRVDSAFGGSLPGDFPVALLTSGAVFDFSIALDTDAFAFVQPSPFGGLEASYLFASATGVTVDLSSMMTGAFGRADGTMLVTNDGGATAYDSIVLRTGVPAANQLGPYRISGVWIDFIDESLSALDSVDIPAFINPGDFGTATIVVSIEGEDLNPTVRVLGTVIDPLTVPLPAGGPLFAVAMSTLLLRRRAYADNLSP